MEINKFENWEPKSHWVYDETGATLMGCHCVVPQDDCGCDDCQERHGYKAWYDREKRCFYQDRDGIVTITAYVSADGFICKEPC